MGASMIRDLAAAIIRNGKESSNGAVKTAFDIQVDGKPGPGRAKMTWKQLIERD